MVKVAWQNITEIWWPENLQHFSVYVSELVEQEIAQGNPEAAARRLAITASIKDLISKDYGFLPDTSETMLFLAISRLMFKRLQ